MEADTDSLMELLRSATHDERDAPQEDDVTMADSPGQSQHDEDSPPSEHAVSTPSDAGADGHSETPASNADSKKRKKSSAEADKSSKPVKKRAPQACQECRSRKVRCDYKEKDGYVTNYPCGNCRHAMVQCIIPPSKRKRRQTHSIVSTHSILPNLSTTSSVENGRIVSDPSPQRVGDSHPEMTTSQVAQAPVLPCRTYGCGSAQLPWGPSEESKAWFAILPPSVRLPAAGKITREGLQYLQQMGALELPNRALEKQLLLAYIQHVQPDFPILELHDFIRRVGDRDGRHGQFSLLLYQSVMFAAAAFIDPEHVTVAGFKNRRALRRSIFQAAKLVYDFDYENDKLTLAQSSLLLSCWYDAPDDAKETWYWSGIAISQAQALGLHRTTVNANTDPVKRRQRRRIWWSCVMRDRQIGLGMSRLIRIKDEDFDIPTIEENDFEIAVLSDNLIISRDDCPMLYDVGMQQELAEMCVEKAKLYVLVGRVLKAVQSFQDTVTTRGDSIQVTLLDSLQTLDKVHRELSAWAAAVPPTCQYRKLERWDVEHGRTPVALQRSLLQMLYQTTVGKIYHPLIRPLRIQESRTDPVAEHHISLVARQKCKAVAGEITRVAGEMHKLELDRYFPTTGVTVIMPAMLVHLQDVGDPNKEAREEAQRGFDTCMSVLNTLRETYAAAEYAAIFMDNVIRNKPGTDRPAADGSFRVAGSGSGSGSSSSSIPPASSSGHHLSTAPGEQPFANASVGSSGLAAMMRSRGAVAGLPQQQQPLGALHQGMSAMGLATMPVITQSPLVDGLTQPAAVQTTTSGSGGFPAAAAAPTAAAPSSGSWPMEELVSHEHSSSDASASSMSPENSSYSQDSGGHNSQEGGDGSGSAEAFGGMDISAEGLSFPQQLDDGWQNWLNLPPELELTEDDGSGWISGPEHIDPGTLAGQGPEVFS